MNQIFAPRRSQARWLQLGSTRRSRRLAFGMGCRRMRGVVLITGAHGIGKTTILQKVAELNGVKRFTASHLIRRSSSEPASASSKVVADADANQRLLISEVMAILDRESNILLDGHVVLLSETSNRFSPIPTRYFEELKISGIVHLDSDAPTVLDNLHKRETAPSRISLVEENLRLERQHSYAIAAEFDVPYIRVEMGDAKSNIDSIAHAVSEILKER